MHFVPKVPRVSGNVKRSLQINARISPEVRDILDKIEAETGLKDQPVLKALIHALCSHYQEYGKLTLPIKLVAEHETQKAGISGAPTKRAS